jgi:hypothetical protein
MPTREKGDVKSYIASVRELLKPTPVRLHHVPQWLNVAVSRVAKAQGWKIPANMDHPVRFGWCLDQLGADGCKGLSGSLDHFGSWKAGKREGFCGEPYQLNAREIAAWEAFAELAGLECYVSADSWWYPGWTLRISVCREVAEGIDKGNP